MTTKRKTIRNRYPDKHKIGNSVIVPYLESEGWSDRHRRRKDAALKNEVSVRRWCNNHRWRFYVNNNGHHWIFYTDQNKQIEWFPSSGKLVIGKNWKEGIHCHDYLQLLELFNKIITD